MADIAVAGVVKRFGAVAAVDGVDLAIGDGELFTLLGPSGCGKTTLLRLLAGFHQPDAGEIRFGGRTVSGLPPYERNIGMVFQNYALWPHMTVAGNVSYGLKLRKLGAAAISARLAEGLQETSPGWSGIRDSWAASSSGCLARAPALNLTSCCWTSCCPTRRQDPRPGAGDPKLQRASSASPRST